MEELDAGAVGSRNSSRVSTLSRGRLCPRVAQQRPGGAVGFEEYRRWPMTRRPPTWSACSRHGDGVAVGRKVQYQVRPASPPAENEHLTGHGVDAGKRERNQTPAATANRWLEDRLTRSPRTRNPGPMRCRIRPYTPRMISATVRARRSSAAVSRGPGRPWHRNPSPARLRISRAP